MKKHFIVFFCVWFLIVVSLIFGTFFLVGSTTHPNKDPIYLIVDSWAGYIPLYVAYENGFFEDEGVDVNFDILIDSETIGEEVIKEDSPYDGYPGVYPPYSVNGTVDFDSRVVYIFDYSYGGDVIVASPDIHSVFELKGKKVGVSFLNGFSHRFLVYLLEKNNLTEGDVEIVEVSAYNVLDALENGEIDAGHTWEPIKTKAVESGYNLIASSKDAPGFIVDVLTIKKDVIEDREEDIQGIVNALVRAHNFIAGNKNGAYSLMSNRTGVPLSDLMGASGGIKLLNLEENKLALSDSSSDISLYRVSEFISEFMLDHGQSDETFLAEGLIDSRFVLNAFSESN
ncbi:ABC transporter substrate-binding protein [Candidatus Pacearchaeota archaeon]|nr:ABC transporter substrate-binding protein [Candidatus Pacearchaeota archaeon]